LEKLRPANGNVAWRLEISSIERTASDRVPAEPYNGATSPGNPQVPLLRLNGLRNIQRKSALYQGATSVVPIRFL